MFANRAYVALTLLILLNLVNYIDRQNLAAVETLIEKDLMQHIAVEDREMWSGFLNSAFLVSFMLFAPFFGWFSDRFSRWVLIGIGVALWSLATGASGLATTYWGLFIARCFVGVGEAAYGPAAPSIIADLFPLEKRGQMISWFYMAIPVGGALGYVLGGYVGEKYGWQWAFYVMVPPGLALAAIAFFFRDPQRGGSEISIAAKQPNRKSSLLDFKRIWDVKSYRYNIFGMCGFSFVVGAVAYFMPRYILKFRSIQDGVPMEHGNVNMIFGGITVVAGLVSTLLGGWLADKLRTKYPGSYFLVSGYGMLFGAVFLLAVVFVPFPYSWVCVFLGVFGTFMNTGPSNTIVTNVVHPTMRASAMGLCIFIMHLLGDVPSPPLIGYIAGHSTWNIAFYVIAGVAFLSGFLWLLGAPYLEADTKNAPNMLP